MHCSSPLCIALHYIALRALLCVTFLCVASCCFPFSLRWVPLLSLLCCVVRWFALRYIVLHSFLPLCVTLLCLFALRRVSFYVTYLCTALRQYEFLRVDLRCTSLICGVMPYFALFCFPLRYLALLCFAVRVFSVCFSLLSAFALRCALSYFVFLCVALRCVALLCVALRYFALLCVDLRLGNALLCVAMRCFMSRCLSCLLSFFFSLDDFQSVLCSVSNLMFASLTG